MAASPGKIERLQTALKEHGFWGVGRIAWYRLRDYPHTRKAVASAEAFDRSYNVETATYVFLSELQDLGPSSEHGLWYQPAAPNMVVFAIRQLGIDPKEFTFIDLGSGKGRVILTASQFPFKAVLGVEFSEKLHAAALRNIQNYTGPVATCARSVHMDASKFEFPPGKIVVFFFNPFKGPVMEAVVQNLHRLAQARQELLIIYFLPMERALFDAQPWLRIVRNSDSYCMYRAVPSS